MIGRRERVAGTVALVLGIAGAAAVLRASEIRHPPQPSTARLLYLRSGETARRLTLSFDAVAADLYWIRAIQHYGRDKKSDRTTGRFELLEPLLDLTTTLDPHFNVAYRFGAVFLSITPPQGPGRWDRAIALLEKGLKHNPNRWQFAHDIGFVHYFYTRDYQEAARWFERAAAMPHAPGWLSSLAATTSLKGGDLASAETIFSELAQAQESYLQQAAQRGLAQVAAIRAIQELEGLIDRFNRNHGRYPFSWDDVIRAGLLPGLPADSTGAPFVYDAATHRVTLSPASPLGPLPELTR